MVLNTDVGLLKAGCISFRRISARVMVFYWHKIGFLIALVATIMILGAKNSFTSLMTPY